MARPRIEDVARKAGVSKTAVSFAFNQPDQLNGATLERILAAAEDLGYRPSPIARRLASRRTDQIGIVVPQATHEVFANPFLPELLRGMGDVCDELGIALVIVPPVGGSIARAVEGALVDGLVLLGLEPDHAELELVRRSGVPVVALDVESWGDADVIAIDDVGGGREVAAHLYALGHRDVAIVLIAEHPDVGTDERGGISGRRLAGIRAGFRDAGRSVAEGTVRLRIASSPVTEEGGRAVFTELLADGLPSAIIAINDLTAIGILLAAREHGLRVPDDLSVVGYDDIPAAAWTSPPLTTVHQPIREKGRLAAARLAELIDSLDGHRPKSELLATRLVVRGSTGPASASARPSTGGMDPAEGGASAT
jgi:DNA-binding LacI/PurR family transcriptional regulator